MAVRGCYEFSLRDCVNGTGAGHVNFLKVVERMLDEAWKSKEKRVKGEEECVDFNSFKAEYLRRLADVTERCRNVAFELEKVLSDVNPANCMTLSTE